MVSAQTGDRGVLGSILFTPLASVFGSHWSLLSGVYARGCKRSHTGGKCVTSCGLHNSEIKTTPALAIEWAVWGIRT